jgi:molybdopterin biosynthesis enzyme
MDGGAIAQQIMDARDLAASGQPTSALVYFEALLPQLVRRAPRRAAAARTAAAGAVGLTAARSHP